MEGAVVLRGATFLRVAGLASDLAAAVFVAGFFAAGFFATGGLVPVVFAVAWVPAAVFMVAGFFAVVALADVAMMSFLSNRCIV